MKAKKGEKTGLPRLVITTPLIVQQANRTKTLPFSVLGRMGTQTKGHQDMVTATSIGGGFSNFGPWFITLMRTSINKLEQ